jgi:hypothetical protein
VYAASLFSKLGFHSTLKFGNSPFVPSFCPIPNKCPTAHPTINFFPLCSNS